MSNDENVLRPIQNNSHGNGLWARIREHTSNVISPSREAAADKENVHPELSQGKDIEEERSKERAREHGQAYEHLEEEEEDDQEDNRNSRGQSRQVRGSREGSFELDDIRDDSPFVRGVRRNDSARHRAAYAEITALADPLPRKHDQTIQLTESLPATPAHKKRRIQEVVESDAMSDEDAGSPSRHSQYSGSAGGYKKRNRVRRRDSLEDSIYDDNEDSMLGGTENATVDGGTPERPNISQLTQKRSLDPNQQLVERLHAEFPGHGFGLEGDKIRCYDCDKLIVQVGEYHVRRHLLSKGHAQANELRRARDDAMSITAPQANVPARHVPQQQSDQNSPLPLYTPNGQMPLGKARELYLAALENETVGANIKTQALRRTVENNDVKSNDRAEELKNKIRDSEARWLEASEGLKVILVRHEEDLKEANQQCRVNDKYTSEQIGSIDGHLEKLKATMKRFEETIRVVKSSSAENEQRNAGFRSDVDVKVANFAGALAKNKMDMKGEVDGITDRIEKLEKHEIKPVKFKEVRENLIASRIQIGEIEAKVRELKETVGSIQSLEGRTALQEEGVQSLELSVQVMTGDLGLCRQTLAQSEVDIKDLRQESTTTNERLTDFERQTRDQEARLEKTFLERMQEDREKFELKLAEQQTAYQEDIAGLVTAFEEQRDTMYGQDVKLKSQALALERLGASLGEYDTTIQNQNRIINKQSLDLEANDSRVKHQAKEFKVQAGFIEHLKKTIPAFMKDLKLVDDKIEDFIEEQAEKERVQDFTVPECAHVPDKGKSLGRRTRPYARSSFKGRRAKFAPRFRR